MKLLLVKLDVTTDIAGDLVLRAEFTAGRWYEVVAGQPLTTNAVSLALRRMAEVIANGPSDSSERPS